jgi:hypothetical protein
VPHSCGLIIIFLAHPKKSTEIFKKREKNNAFQNHHPKHHNSPSTHHKITINYHPKNTSSPKTPSKKHNKNAKKRPALHSQKKSY